MLKRVLQLCLLVVVVSACQNRQPDIYTTGEVFVRSVVAGKCYSSGCDYTLVLERRGGEVFSMWVFGPAPPVWPGMRCNISYEDGYGYNSDQCRIVAVRRLPD